MSYKNFILLQLFADGTGAASSGGSNGTAADAGQSQNGTQNTGKTETKVVYGLQPDDSTDVNNAAVQDTSSAGDTEKIQSEADRRKAYKEFIKNNKDLHAEEVQKIIDRRFRENKEREETVKKQERVLDHLYARYGVDDIDALTQKVENDTSLLYSESDELGLDGESAEMKRLRIEKMRISRQLKENAEAERRRRFNRRIGDEGRDFKAKNKLSDFSVADEINNDPNFARLLRAGLSVEQAYNTIHHDEIMQSAMRLAQADAVRRTADNVRARGSRPRENGAGGAPGVVVKNDVSALTRADRAEIARRAILGDKISLG